MKKKTTKKQKERKKEKQRKKTTRHSGADTQKDQLHPPIPGSLSPPLSQAIRYHAGCVIGWQRIERDILKLGSNLISTRLRGCCEIVGCRNEQHAEPVGRRTSELERDDNTGRWKCLRSDSKGWKHCRVLGMQPAPLLAPHFLAPVYPTSTDPHSCCMAPTLSL